VAPPEERRSINVTLNRLDESTPVDFTRYPECFDPLGKDEHDQRLRGLSRWNFNGATYALDRIWQPGRGRIRIDARRGTYFWSVATSELLDKEFMRVQGEAPERDLTTPTCGCRLIWLARGRSCSAIRTPLRSARKPGLTARLTAWMSGPGPCR
jgi:hypothetical protein